MKVNEASPLVTLPNNRLAVAVLNSRTPGRPAEFSEVQAQIRDKMTNDRAAQIANDRAKEFAEKVKKGEDITKLAKAMGLDVTNSSMFGRVDSIDGLGPAATLEDAFSAPVGGVLGPLSIQGRNVVARVAEKAEADMAALPVEHDTILAEPETEEGSGPQRASHGRHPGETDQRRQGDGATRKKSRIWSPRLRQK